MIWEMSKYEFNQFLFDIESFGWQILQSALQRKHFTKQYITTKNVKFKDIIFII